MRMKLMCSHSCILHTKRAQFLDHFQNILSIIVYKYPQPVKKVSKYIKMMSKISERSLFEKSQNLGKV